MKAYKEDLMRHKDEFVRAAKLSSHSIIDNGFVLCLNSDQASVTLQTTAGALGKCTNYLKPESDDISAEFHIPEVAIANGIHYPVTGIARGVFDSMKALRDIFIPQYVKDIKWSFWECERLENILVDSNNTNYCDIDGVLFSYDKQTLIAFPQNKSTEYVIPEGVKRIHNLAFKNNRRIQKLYIPDTVSYIGINAFYRCTSLKEIRGHRFHNITIERMYGKWGDVDPKIIFDVNENDPMRTLHSMMIPARDDERDDMEVYP